MKDDEESCLSEEASYKAEEPKRARLEVEEAVRLALEARRRAEEEEQHARLKAEEESRLAEESRLKVE